eukprot:5009325-Alexandrium_andersonii.AAC.1
MLQSGGGAQPLPAASSNDSAELIALRAELQAQRALQQQQLQSVAALQAQVQGLNRFGNASRAGGPGSKGGSRARSAPYPATTGPASAGGGDDDDEDGLYATATPIMPGVGLPSPAVGLPAPSTPAATVAYASPRKGA